MAFEPCPNCNAHIGCSCEYQTAKDGTICCDACVHNYNLALDLATAIVDMTPIQKTKPKDEPDQLPGGAAEPPADE